MLIENMQDMAAAALASGTHRVRIHTGESGLQYGELVEREEPDPEILYMGKAKGEGHYFVCETPVEDFLGKRIELVGVFDPSIPFRFKLVVQYRDESGNPVTVPLEPKY